MASGALADRFGRKRVFMAGVVVFGISSLACGLATNAPVLIVARVVQGVGGAALLACQMAVLSYQFRDSPDRGMAFSAWGIAFGARLGFGPLIGGVTVTFIGWEWVFPAHVPLAAVTLLLAHFAIAESSDPHAVRIDGAGIAKPVAERALTDGFGCVMLYALICAWSLSILSFVVLRREHFVQVG
ncbi:hypothetical protein CEV33_3395 [Brucella grignonensis]|uniref:Major facilitator superfamily (MFS) profile domain-containing protein n=2 Tax=Brucella grignonensis TaxID=94627 RepID=A0A256EZ05_9HYPH|nr:hypothetical protein CEV33_3395 [Brucella grignonensis]